MEKLYLPFPAVIVWIALSGIPLRAPSTTQSTAPRSRAVEILEALAGTWTFTLGNTTGTRDARLLYAGTVVEWSETFDGRDAEGKGFIGYDAAQDLFFSMTVHNGVGNYGFMVGRLEPDEDAIVFEAVHRAPDEDAFRSLFRRRDADSFTFTALVKDGDDDDWSSVWTATFERRR